MKILVIELFVKHTVIVLLRLASFLEITFRKVHAIRIYELRSVVLHVREDYCSVDSFRNMARE